MQIRRALVRSEREVEIETVDLPDAPGAGQVLLKTRASFISAGTELAIYSGLDPNVRVPGAWCCYPFVPGYANVAEVAAVGANVTAVAPGDRVFTFGKHCSHHLFGGGLMVKVPDQLDDATAAAARMAMVAITSLQVADLALNDWVAVFGLGMVGNLAAQLFRLSGARVIGIDPAPVRRELAEKVGIEHTVGGSPEEVAIAVKELTGGGVRIAIDAVGDSRVVHQAAQVTAAQGEVILLGSPRAPVETNVTDVLWPVHYSWVTFKGALEWRIPLLPVKTVRHSTQGNLETILDLIERGRLHVAELISHRLPADQIKKAYEGLLIEKDTYWGVVLDWTGKAG